MQFYKLAVVSQSPEQPIGHSVLAGQPVTQALGLSSLRQESPLLSIPPAMHLRASPLPVNSLPLIEFSLLFILLSALYPSHCYPPFLPFSWAHLLSFLYSCYHQHFFFGISESKHFLHIKMWNSFWHWTGNRVEPAIYSYLFLSLLPSPLPVALSLSLPHSLLTIVFFFFFNPWIHSPTSLS